jgi:acetyl/propionyl-CoA carboxylase alpha subunit
VTHFYDPLLAKLTVHAEDREAAIQRMQTALREFIVHGVVTNLDFLQAVLSHPDFAEGKVSTRWVESNLESRSELLENQQEATTLHIIAAALAELTTANRKSEIVNQNDPDPYSPWKTSSGFRN